MMNNNIVSFLGQERMTCCACGNEHAQVAYETESFPYGIGENQVTLTARVPVISCEECGSRLTDGSAEDIRHAAVCRHLGRLAPDAIRAIREGYGLSQQEWADRTGIGIASVKRWEAGNLIQNDAMDRYLRLLLNRENFAKVTTMSNPPVQEINFRFQTRLSEAVLQGASSFVLRKSFG
jgi:putative zinc finger/helix-turn-helix YgiT family protein